MKANSILEAIANMKLDVPSQDYVEVKMEHLEELLIYIREVEKVSGDRANRVNLLIAKVEMMNCLVKDVKPRPKLDTYM